MMNEVNFAVGLIITITAVISFFYQMMASKKGGVSEHAKQTGMEQAGLDVSEMPKDVNTKNVSLGGTYIDDIERKAMEYKEKLDKQLSRKATKKKSTKRDFKCIKCGKRTSTTDNKIAKSKICGECRVKNKRRRQR